MLAARGASRATPRDVEVIQREIAPDARFGPFGRAQAGGVTPGPVAGAADVSTAGVERPATTRAVVRDEEPEAPPPDPITQTLDDAQRVERDTPGGKDA